MRGVSKFYLPSGSNKFSKVGGRGTYFLWFIFSTLSSLYFCILNLPLKSCDMFGHNFFSSAILNKVSSQSDKIKNTKKNWINFRFFSFEFKWLWLVAGNRYLQCDGGLGEVDVLNEVGGLTVGELRWRKLYKMS